MVSVSQLSFLPPRRSPHGERGLKYCVPVRRAQTVLSLSSWRAWIEIWLRARQLESVSSLSSWRAWIEIFQICVFVVMILVALLMESVD